MSWIRNSLLLFGSTLIALAIAEILVFALYLTTPSILFPNHVNLNSLACKNERCLAPRLHQSLGWNTFREDPYGDGIRENVTYGSNEKFCVAAFGDSFTYSNDVKAADAWTSLLGEKLGCGVKNYGVGGYSVVQAIKKFEHYKPNEDLIILLVYEEMLKRNLTASNFFIGGKDSGNIVLRPFIDRNRDLREIPANVTSRANIEEHIYADWFSKAPILDFPFLYNWAQFSLWKEKLPNHSEVYPSSRFSAWESKDPDFWMINTELLENSTSLFKGKKVVVAFLPSSTKLERSDKIEKLIESLDVPKNFCVLNPAKEIQISNPNNSNLLGKTNHFNELGERLLAESLYDGLVACRKLWD